MQQLKEAKREIQVLISTNQLPEAIKALKALLPEESPKHKEIILLEGRLNEINLRRIRGLASNEELRLTYNNLRNDLVELVQQIQEADLALAALMLFSGVSYAAAPQEVEWLGTRYLYNTEQAFDNYIQRWENLPGLAWRLMGLCAR